MIIIIYLCLLLESFLTAIIQSSTAMTGIAMGFLQVRDLTVDTGIAYNAWLKYWYMYDWLILQAIGARQRS